MREERLTRSRGARREQHFSARYSRDASDLDREAKAVFPHVTCARDGMELEIAYEADDAPA